MEGHIRPTEKKNILEICAGSYTSAVAALDGGAQRIELCCALGEGGLTPSAGLLEAVSRLKGIRKHVLIRPRGGDFLYSEKEKSIMLADIGHVAELNFDGIAVGALKENGSIDKAFIRSCVKAAGGMSVTFHRAFDLCANPKEELKYIIDCGCNRLLTSGQATTAEKGIPLLKELVRIGEGQIVIMPGCGVTSENAFHILNKTGAKEIHSSARCVMESKMHFRLQGITMGHKEADEYSVKETSAQLVKKLLEAINP